MGGFVAGWIEQVDPVHGVVNRPLGEMSFPLSSAGKWQSWGLNISPSNSQAWISLWKTLERHMVTHFCNLSFPAQFIGDYTCNKMECILRYVNYHKGKEN